MSITLNPLSPPNSESPRLGALRIRNLTAALLALLNQPTGSSQTIGGPFIASLDANGIPTFPSLSAVQSDPTTALGLVTKQYVDAKTPYAVAAGGDAYTATVTHISALATGQELVVKFPQANTGTLPSLDVNSLGPVSIKMADGSAPAIGDIHAATYLLIYDGATVTWVIAGVLPASVITGTFPLASDGNANSHKITGLANGTVTGDAMNFGQFTGTAAASGHFILPILDGGVASSIKVNWGVVASGSHSGTSVDTNAITFDSAFSSAVYAVVCGLTADNDAPSARQSEASVLNGSLTTSGFTLLIGNQASGSATTGAYYIAIGK